MFGLFKKKEKKVCIHDWHLIDSFLVPINSHIEVEVEEYYTVACPKCNAEKSINKREYPQFEKTFNVKAPR